MYVQLQENTTEAEVNTAIQDIIKENNSKAPTAKLFLHPMSKWRLYSNFENGKNSGGLIDYVQLFTAIAIFVLVIACINFMNLATARSERRAREVGIRKSVGSRRKAIDLSVFRRINNDHTYLIFSSNRAGRDSLTLL
jgi:putative ABC transport system permease protein